MLTEELHDRGICIDYPSFSKEVLEPASKELEEIKQSIFTIIGECNLDDIKDVIKHLYQKGYKPAYGLPEDWLKNNPEEVFRLIYQYKKTRRFLNQYGPNFQSYIHTDGRIHAEFKANASVTGRYSASNPPVMALDGRLMKYLCAPEGKALIAVDFKSMEVRALAALCRDPFLIRMLSFESLDFYRQIGALLFNKTVDDVADDERTIAKQLCIAIIYGASSKTLSANISKKMRKGISEFEAQRLKTIFLNSFPAVKSYQKGLVQGTLPCRSLSGKVFNGNLSSTQKLNFPVQATAAEGFDSVIKCIDSLNPNWILCLIVHDAFYVEVPHDEADEAIKVISETSRSRMTKFLGVACFTENKILNTRKENFNEKNHNF